MTTTTHLQVPGPLRPDPRPADEITVASVPSGHVYVRHLAPYDGGGPRRLPDPDPETPDRPAGAVWWPPVMLDPAWVASADFDLFHVHFGFDACDPELLREVTRVLRSRGKPFVYTVHDLRNPHHETREVHDAQLDVLVPAADALITLTDGAAGEIYRRWGRRARVLPHPHVVDETTADAVQRERAARVGAPFRVGLHVKSLRSSMDPKALLPTLLETVHDLPDGVLQVNAHRDVLDDDGLRRDDELATWLRDRAARGEIDLRVHDFLPDDELWRYLGSLDVSVLPYRFGTHSGWLEACRDLGTTVVAPTCGYFADQGPVLSYEHDETGLDPASLAAAIRTAYDERPAFAASATERRAQRREVAAAHDEIYRAVLAGSVLG